MQLALPAPFKYVGTSLLASLLKINICHHLTGVKQKLIISPLCEINYYFHILYSDLLNMVIFNILKKYSVISQVGAISQKNTKEIERA